MFYKNFKSASAGLIAFVLLLAMSFTSASGVAYDKRTLRGVYLGSIDDEEARDAHEDLHLNYIWDDAKFHSSGLAAFAWYDSLAYCRADLQPLNAIATYLYRDYRRPCMSSVMEWKAISLDATEKNRMTIRLGEEKPLRDPLVYDAVNYIISEIAPEDELVCALDANFTQIPPDYFLWIEGLDLFWVYPKPANSAYYPSDPLEQYQDGLQFYCVDPYNKAANQFKMYRRWGSNPDLMLGACLQGAYTIRAEGPDNPREATDEEMLCEGWVSFSRGAKAFGHYFFMGGYPGTPNSQIALTNDDYTRNPMFNGAAEFLGQIETVENNLKAEPYNYAHGLYEVDVDTFRSVQGEMVNPLYYVRHVTPLNMPLSEAYYEVSTHRSLSHSFFLLFNRSLQRTDPITYLVKVGVPYGKGIEWDLVDLVSGTRYDGQTSDEEDALYATVTLGPGEAGFFILEFQGGSGTTLQSNCREATGYSNGRKLALSEIDGTVHAFIAYTDLDESLQPHVDYAMSNDMGVSWHKVEKIPQGEYPAIAVSQGYWPVIAYRSKEAGQGSRRIYKVRDCAGGEVTELDLRVCESGGSPPSITILPIDNNLLYECHVVFYDNQASRLCHYIINKEDFNNTDPDNPTYEYHELYWPSPPVPRRPTVVCDSFGNPFIFFAYDDDIHNQENRGYIYYWDGESDDATKLTFAEGWDGTAYIEDPTILLTWVAPDQCTWPRGEIHAKRGLLKYVGNGSGKLQPWITWVTSGDYEVIDPNVDMGEVQPMGTNAALWQSQINIHFSARDEDGRDPSNPWIPRIPVASHARCPQSALEPELYTYATAWTKGDAAPYSIEVTVDELSGIPGGDWGEVYVASPNGGERWYPGETRTITWYSSYGSNSVYDSPNRWTIYISTDGGITWPESGSGYYKPVPNFQHEDGSALFSSTITAPWFNSSQCRVKVEAWTSSTPGDRPYDISDENFKIGWGDPHSPDYNYISGPQPPGTQRGIYWEETSAMGLQGIGFGYSTDNGGSWNDPTMLLSGSLYSPDDSLLLDTLFNADSTDTAYLYKYWGTIDWTIPNTPTSAAKIKLTAYDTLGDTASHVQTTSFVIPLPGGWERNTYANQEVWGLNDAGSKMGLFYTGRNPADTLKPIIYYTESPDGYSLDVPDSIAIGLFPCHQQGEAFWLSRTRDTIFGSYWDNALPNWSNPTIISTDVAGFDTTLHSPIGIDLDADTVHVVFEKRLHKNNPLYEQWDLIHVKILKDVGTVLGIDTLFSTTAGYLQSNEAPSIKANGDDVYVANEISGQCAFAEKTPTGQFSIESIGNGIHPLIALTEGNVTYTYLAPDGKSLIRLWRYRDDSVWVERDTFTLTDSLGFLTGQNGILYSAQVGDTSICKTYLYDPLGQRLIRRATYQGGYPHSYLWRCSDDQWTECYTAYLDTFRFVKTETNDLNAFFPSLYQEAKLRRSPYTAYRDTCVEYHDCTVDYGADSLVYGFSRLNPARSYAVMVEFYFESETDTTISILANVGGTVDTIEVPNNSYVWHQVKLPPASSSFTLKLMSLSGGLVSVSRLAVGQVDASHIMSAGGVKLEPEQPISFCLYQPFPNPFGDAATIRYSVPYATHVNLKVYDVSGRMVTKLVDGEVDPGLHTLRWEGRDDINRRCASGVYFVRFAAEDYVASKKMVLLK